MYNYFERVSNAEAYLMNLLPYLIGRIHDEDENEDYDSELDDFIDDEVQENTEDYSKYISQIFGYDKNKYKFGSYDEDDAAMESSFAQQLKEEYVSTKIGNIKILFFSVSM